MPARFSRTTIAALSVAIAASGLSCSSSDDRSPTLGGADIFGSGGGGGAPGGFSWGTCPEGFQKQCANVDVPLDWSAPDGETISVLVARRPARGARTGQLWLLQGGPGGSGADFYTLLDVFADIAPGLDIYTLDHRGVGHSTRLGCPEQEAATSEWQQSVSPDEYPACLAHVEAEWGDGLAHFNTTSAARDLAHLIGSTRDQEDDVFVLGISYGTYWALRYLQVEPSQATGVILDSIAPPNFFISGFDAQFDPVGRELMQACSDDASCAARLGADAWSRLASIFDLVDAGHCASVGFTREELRGVMSGMLRSWGLREFVPALASRLERCDPADEAAIEHFAQVVLASDSEPDLLFSDVLHHHVALSELWEQPPPPLEDLDAIVDASLFAPGYAPRVGSQYDRWPRYPRDAFVGAWASTSIPLLMMNGTMDPQTPLGSAKTVEDHFRGPNQHFVTVPLAAHTVIVQSPTRSVTALPCGFQMLQGFLANPRAEPNDACLANLQPIGFDSDPSTAVVVWGVASMWDNPGATAIPGPSSVRPRSDWARVSRALQHRRFGL